jgi:hypothetical protein
VRTPARTGRPKRSIAAISFALIAITAGQARAQSADAETLFNDGKRLLDEGKVAEACDAFEASNRIETRAGTLIRLGECREKNDQLASAWSAYKDALTRVKDTRKKQVASAKLGALEPRLSYLTVSVPLASKLDGLAVTRNGKPLDPGLWNRAVPVDGGDYTIEATAPGHKPWRSTTRVPTEHGKLSITVNKLEEAPAAVAAKPAEPAEPAHAAAANDDERERPMPPPHTFTTRRKIAVAVLGAGVVSVLIGAGLGHAANGDKDQAYALCPDPAMPCSSSARANSLISTAHDRAIEADVGFAVGAAAAIVGATLWFTGAPKYETVGAIPSPHGASVVFMGRF